MFARILVCALLSGAGAGLVAGILQWYFIQPILLHAELYETGLTAHFTTQIGSSAIPPARHLDLTRDSLSLILSMIINFGYALVLIPLMVTLSNAKPTAVQGILWGLAGYMVVLLAPAFGLAPELPGVAAADVGQRQLWWFGTVAISATSIAMMIFGKNQIIQYLAGALLILPHLFGAPHPDTFIGSAPPELAALFVSRVLGVGLISWLALGLMITYFWRTQDD